MTTERSPGEVLHVHFTGADRGAVSKKPLAQEPIPPGIKYLEADTLQHLIGEAVDITLQIKKLEQRLKENKSGYSCKYFKDDSDIPRLQFVIIDDDEVLFFASS